MVTVVVVGMSGNLLCIMISVKKLLCFVEKCWWNLNFTFAGSLATLLRKLAALNRLPVDLGSFQMIDGAELVECSGESVTGHLKKLNFKTKT